MSLPANVTAAPDRHGRIRFRFRKKGLPSRYLPDPASPEFGRAYDACFSTEVGDARPKRRRRIPLSRMKGVSVVYFIGLPSGDVKIGTTVDLPNRFKKLQTGCPFRMELLAVIMGDATLEAEYHTRFAAFRRRGEWFNGPAVNQEVKRLKQELCCLTPKPSLLSNRRNRNLSQ